MDLTKITAWIKANLLLTGGIVIVAILLFFPKMLRDVFGSPRRKVRHRASRTAPAYTTYARRRRRLPRSVGMSKARPSYRRRTRTKGSKKPWQIKGSLAARRHMALIRKRR